MASSPAITVTAIDFERIYRLLDTKSDSELAAMSALMDELDRATVVEPHSIRPDVVTMNSTVRFVDDASGSEMRLTLVYPEAAGQPDTVSILAPVGAALLGLSIGQSIEWQVPEGRKLKLRVLEVVRQPADAAA